jgi:hypothetical protein
MGNAWITTSEITELEIGILPLNDNWIHAFSIFGSTI